MTGPAPFPPMTTARPRPPAPPIGWPLLVNPATDGGRLRAPTLEKSLENQISVVLLTTPGEQLMRPEFGAGLARLRHEPNTLQTRTRVRDEIVAALRRFETRIDLTAVEVAIGNHPWEVAVTIRYRSRFTQEPGSLSIAVPVGAV